MKFGKWLVAVVMACAMVACGDDDDPNDPGNSVPDPEGTVLLSMRNWNNGRTYLEVDNGDMWIDVGDNFNGDSGRFSFVNLGKMKGLGNVTKIPTSGWAEKVAVTPGCGYIAQVSDMRGVQYIRIYVVDYIISAETTNGIIGANIKYQYPFIPEEALLLNNSSVRLDTKAGSSATVDIKRYAAYDISVSSDWLKATKGEKNITITALTEAPANANAEDRIAHVYISDKTGYPNAVEVRQKSGNLQFEDFGGQVELAGTAGSSKTIKIEYYLPYELWSGWGYDNVLKVTTNEKEITFTALMDNQNISSQELANIQVVDAAGYYRYIKVVQKPGKQ